MKTSLGILLPLGLGSALMAQSDAPLPVAGSGAMSEQWIPASRSDHATRWQSVTLQTNALGRVVERTNSYTELATGLNYYDEATQAWQPSREEWLVYPDGIVARAGRTKVVLAHNLNLAGSVDVLLPDGVTRLISNPVSLGFYDPVDGKQTILAEVKDCPPQRGAAANEIVFRDCFDGIRGSIRYLYTRAGFHQHVVIEERLALPAGFSDKSRLEFYTEFAADTPAPRLETRVLWGEPDPGLRALMVEPDFTDAELSFGAEMAMRAGKAFSLGTEDEESPERSVRVCKQMQTIDGKPVLIEAVEFKQLEPLLARLAAVETSETDRLAINTTRRINGSKEQARLSHERFGTELTGEEIQLASQPLSQPAVVIDYELLSSDTNFTFKGDTTYFVSSSVILSGTTTLEGGSVVKFTNLWWPKISITGPIRCETGPYRPVIFTVKDDNSVGATIVGSTGNPTNQFGSGLAITSLGNTLTNLRFAHLYEAIAFDSGGDAGELYLGNAQFVKCRYPLRAEQTMCFLNCGATIQLDNALITQCDAAFRGEIGILRGRHVTVKDCNWLGDDFGDDSALYLTNSLLVAVSNWGNMTYTTNTTVRYATDPGGIFQTVGAGAFYLANNSANRNAGTTNLNADLLAALRQKTTYPPVLLSNVTLTASTNLLPQVARDTDTPDLGYHYDPLDFIVARCAVTNATLTLSNGVALGYYNRSAGIWLQDNSAINSVGSPLSPNWFAHYTLVQEQPVFIGDVPMTSAQAVNSYHYGDTGPEGQYRFTHFSCPGGAYGLYHAANWAYSGLLVRDCQFWNGGNELTGAEGSVAALHNNLFVRSGLGAFADASSTLTLSNNLVRHAEVVLLNQDNANLWRIHNNAFDHCAVSSLFTPLTNSHNAYINCDGRLSPTNINDMVLQTFSYASGPLGDFYHGQADLIDKGDKPADDLGFYHFTTTTNQAKETNSIVDIGFHYVALNLNGLPHDTDEDGIPDYDDPDSTPRTDIVWSNGVWHWKHDSLAWNCWTNAMACTNQIQGSFYSVFSPFSMPTNRNPAFWFRHFTGWPAYSVWNNCNTNLWPTNTDRSCGGGTTYQGAGVLVSPEHFITTGHMGFPSNTWLVFMDMTNNIVFRQVQDYLYKSVLGGEPTNNLSTNMPAPPHSDYYIGLLDQPVPENIGFVRVIPTNWWAWFDAPFYNNATNHTFHVPLLLENCQHRSPVMRDLDVLNCLSGYRWTEYSQRTLTNWVHDTRQGGDSGSPWFLVLDGELCLARILSSSLGFGIPVEYPEPAYMQACVNAAMSELSFRNGRTNTYSLAVKDLSKYPIYRQSYDCSQ